MDLEEEMSASRKALSDIQNVVNGLSVKNPAKHELVSKNKNHSLTSSTPSKRPSAESSIYEKGKSSSKPFHFSFSASDLDFSAAGSPTSRYLNGQSDNYGKSNEPSNPGKLKSQVEDEAKNSACGTLGSKQVIPGDSCSEKSVSFNTISLDINTWTKDSHNGLVDTNECNNVEILHAAVPSAQPDIGNDDLSRGSTDTAVQAHGLSVSENNAENIQQVASSTQEDANIDDSTTENFKISQSHREPFVAEDHIMDVLLYVHDVHTTDA